VPPNRFWGTSIPNTVTTAYAGGGVLERAVSAGVIGYLSKPFEADDLLVRGRLAPRHGVRGREVNMITSGGSVQCASGILGQHRHICAFFNSVDEEHRVLRSFIKEGFERGEKAFHIVDPQVWEDHLRRLAKAGIDVQQAMGTGQLELRRWQDAYLRGDCFDQDGMLALIEEVLQSGAESGYPLTRFISHAEWALVDKAGIENWLGYETRVNYLLPKYHDPVICCYDLSKFSASVVIDLMRTHPVVIIGDVLQENPFFVPPDQFLLELAERHQSSRMH
jgi:CheY-like chemotaxis protein